MLPPDAQAYGFDTNADALSMEPALLDRYLTAAAKIARLAIGDPTAPPDVRALHRRQGQLQRTDLAVADRPPGRRLSAGLAGRDRRATLSSRWMASMSIKVRLARTYADADPWPEPCRTQIEIRVDGTRVGTVYDRRRR